MKQLFSRLYRSGVLFLKSNHFFVIILVLFALQVLWLIFTARYPMVYDENYHFLIARAYTDHLSPFMTSQEVKYDSLGDIVRYPSYLYHYIMSFPLRLVEQFTNSTYIQVVTLRIISATLIIAALVVFRKVLLLIFSKSVVHLALLLLVSIPPFVLLSAHINYDSLLFLLTAIFFYFSIKFIQLKAARSDVLAIILIIGMFASLVKYVFVPLFVVALVFLGWYAWSQHKTKLLSVYKKDFKKLRRRKRYVLVAFFLLGVALISERYIGNLIQYRSPNPDCAKVLSIERCKHYGPWQRNYHLEKDNQAAPDPEVVDFTLLWTQLMLSTATDTGAATVEKGTISALPMPLVKLGMALFWAAGIICTIYYWRDLKKNKLIVFGVVIGLSYVGILWALNYTEALKYSSAVAINWRYTLPVFPFIAALFVYTINRAVPTRVPIAKIGVVTVFMILFSQGGGFTTYILRSDHTWYWKHTPLVWEINDGAKKILKPLIKEH